MKKQTALLACLTLALCMPAFAQTSGTDNSQTQSDSMKSGKMMGKKMSATGCIAEKDGKFMLMNKKHPDGVELMTSEDLKPHVGHKVKLMGTMDNNSMNVTSMKMISTSCDMGGMMK